MHRCINSIDIVHNTNHMRQYSSPRGVRLKCYYAFFLECCGCDTSYIVSVHIQCLASIYTLSLCRGHSWRLAASQAGDADSSRAPDLISCLQSVNVHRGTLLLVQQCQCISSSVFKYHNKKRVNQISHGSMTDKQ